VKVKRYTAATMQEAIDQIRHDLGPNAVILHSRKVGRGGVMNLLGKPVIEVTAAVDEAPVAGPEAEPLPEAKSSPEAEGRNGGAEEGVDHRLAAYLDLSGPGAGGPVTSRRARMAGATGVVEQFQRRLVANDVDELLAEALVRSAVEDLRTADDAGLIARYIEKRIEGFIRVTGPVTSGAGKPKVVALVGPTGVGKTTTAAKLAARFSGVERKRVAIITADVLRVAGVEQMRVYAKLLKVPVDVVLSPTDLNSTIAGHSDKDLVIIDTGGRSPYNWMQIAELSGFMSELREAEVHLVLSAATRCKENLAVAEQFAAMRFHSLLFTKLDETRDYGSLLTVAVKSKRPISYLTAGQNIPDDIEPASSAKLARMILGTELERVAGQPATGQMATG